MGGDFFQRLQVELVDSAELILLRIERGINILRIFITGWRLFLLVLPNFWGLLRAGLSGMLLMLLLGVVGRCVVDLSVQKVGACC